MFKRFYQKKAEAQTVEFFPYVVRDSITHQVLIKGTLEKCQNYVSSFGMCYVEGV